MGNFSFIDLCLFLGISQGVFLAITLQFAHQKNQAANKILSIILLMAALMISGRLFYFRYQGNELFFRLAILGEVMILLFGPLAYTYTRRLAFRELPNFRLSFFHFLPALLHLSFAIWVFTLTQDRFHELLYAGTLNIPYLLIEGGGLISCLFYIFISFRLVKLYQKAEVNNLSYTQQIPTFLYSFLSAILIFLSLWLVSFVRIYLLQDYISSSYNFVWTSIPIFIYVIGFYSLKQPDIFRIPLPIRKEKSSPIQKMEKDRLGQEEVNKLKTQIERLMVEEKIYLNNKLTLSALAEQLNTSTNNISWLLNNIYESSFYDYINQYRVKEFIQRIQQGEHQHHTLLAISMDVGFNSKSTFNKAFKNIMHDTPSNYIRKMATS
ncbi:MAG: AraC family transcriptional regulator [Bacteroidota bacterium]